jgi:hypothetical protein
LWFLGEHLCQLLAKLGAHHNEARTHLALDKDTPFRRSVQTVGRIASISLFGDFHHQYVQMA